MSDSGGECDWCPNYVENGEGRYPFDGDDTRICDVCYERGSWCFHCGDRIHEHEGVFLNSTGGDVCCADKFTEKNENGRHEPVKWVIAGPVDGQEKLYWSNDIGWGSLAIATVFPHTDFNLPTFGMEGIDVRWEALTETILNGEVVKRET